MILRKKAGRSCSELLKNKTKLQIQKKITKWYSCKEKLFLVTINVNELNSPIQRTRISDWITKENPVPCTL